MATVAEVTAGNYIVDTRVHQVQEVGEFDYVEVRDLSRFLNTEDSYIDRDTCRTQDNAVARLHFVFTDDEIQSTFGQSTVPWSSMKLRPSMKLTSLDRDAETDWINLGVYIPETPKTTADQRPNVFNVECHDLISMLALPTGTVFGVSSTIGIAIAIRAIFALRGDRGEPIVPQIPITQNLRTGVPGTVPSSGRQWTIDQEVTWLGILDQLLEMVGWRTPWVDRDGLLTSEPWVDPNRLPSEMTITNDPRTSIVDIGLSSKEDVWGVPNNWIFIRSDFDPDVSAPSDGAGIYRRENLNTGPSSQFARGGRKVSKVMRVDATDQASLVAFGDRVVLQDSIVPQSLCLDIAPQPVPWHRSVVTVTHSELGIEGDKYLVRNWKLPLDGGNASLVLDKLVSVP